MDDPSWPVQQAVFAALTAGVAGLTPVPGVYDAVPAGADGKASFPYFYIVNVQVVSEKDQCHDAMSVFVTLQGLSRSPSGEELGLMMKAACAALDVKLAVTGFGVIGSEISDGPRTIGMGDRLTRCKEMTVHYRMASAA